MDLLNWKHHHGGQKSERGKRVGNEAIKGKTSEKSHRDGET